MGTTNGRLAEGEEDTNGNFLKPLAELAVPSDQLAPVEITTESQSPSPAEPDAPTGDIPPPVGDEGEPPSGLEPDVVSTRPSSPVAEGENNPTIPPFQFTQPLDLSNDSRRNDFESPNGEVTRPY